MLKPPISLLLALLLFAVTSISAAEGLPVAKYLDDPEHKDEIILFYLSTLFSGINLANSRSNPPLFCITGVNTDSAFSMIDKRINKMQKANRITEETTVDNIIMDILMEEFPCK